MKSKPLISIITAVYNGEKTLEKTIQSVINQTYENIEFIIIDGGSSDRTVDIIKKYEDKIDYWVSEKDRGISDAFNKGILASKGDYINFQGDSDIFVSNSVIEEIFKNIDSSEDMLVCGRVNVLSPQGKIIHTTASKKNFNKKELLKHMALPHQGLFTHRKLFEKYGLFDIDNIYCMDYEHLLKYYENFPVVIAKDIIVSNWQLGGIGTGKKFEILDEYHQIKLKHKVASVLKLNIIHQWNKLKLTIKKVLGKED